MTTSITFDESKISDSARRLLEAGRTEYIYRVIWAPNSDGLTTIDIHDNRDNDDVLEIWVVDGLTWAERARKFGVPGIDKSNQSGRWGSDGPIPTEEYIKNVIRVYGEPVEHGRFTVPRWIVSQVRHGKLSDLDAINAIGDAFDHFCKTGQFLPGPHASGTKPDTSIFLGEERKSWLKFQGGIQPTIQKLIDDARGEKNEHGRPERISLRMHCYRLCVRHGRHGSFRRAEEGRHRIYCD